jgi:hypothetical protein
VTRKRVAVIQSSYIPWKGYFDIINDVDEFIFYDDVQFTRQDWRSRNKIKTADGTLWLSIPTGDSLNRNICEVELSSHHWQVKHWKSILQNYSRAPFFTQYRAFFEDVYVNRTWTNLSEFNQFLIREICVRYLGITTTISDSRAYGAHGQKQERLMDILKKAGATLYVSGPSARNYIDEAEFERSRIELQYKGYDGYPDYAQLYPPLRHDVSILDLLFNVGPDAPRYIWGWRS